MKTISMFFAVVLFSSVVGLAQSQQVLPRNDLRTPRCGIAYRIQGGGTITSECAKGVPAGTLMGQQATLLANQSSSEVSEQASVASPVQQVTGLYRQALQSSDHEAQAQAAVRSYSPTQNAQSTGSRMMVDDLDTRISEVSNKTAISIGKPMPFEQMGNYYQGYTNFSFQGVNLPGSVYPQYSSNQPAQQLPAYIQQELFEEYQRSGQFNPLIPATGQMSQHLEVLSREAQVGQGVLRDIDGKPTRVQIGPDTWTTSNYVVVSSVGILEEQVNGRQIRGEDIARILDNFPVGNRGRRFIWDILGRSQKTTVDRMVVGILYVAIVDVETRSVVKASTGIAAMSYTELSQTDLPAIRIQGVRYAGAGKFARELVLSAMYDEVDRGASVEKFLKRRGVELPIRNQLLRR